MLILKLYLKVFQDRKESKRIEIHVSVSDAGRVARNHSVFIADNGIGIGNNYGSFITDNDGRVIIQATLSPGEHSITAESKNAKKSKKGNACKEKTVMVPEEGEISFRAKMIGSEFALIIRVSVCGRRDVRRITIFDSSIIDVIKTDTDENGEYCYVIGDAGKSRTVSASTLRPKITNSVSFPLSKHEQKKLFRN